MHDEPSSSLGELPDGVVTPASCRILGAAGGAELVAVATGEVVAVGVAVAGGGGGGVEASTGGGGSVAPASSLVGMQFFTAACAHVPMPASPSATHVSTEQEFPSSQSPSVTQQPAMDDRLHVPRSPQLATVQARLPLQSESFKQQNAFDSCSHR